MIVTYLALIFFAYHQFEYTYYLYIYIYICSSKNCYKVSDVAHKPLVLINFIKGLQIELVLGGKKDV